MFERIIGPVMWVLALTSIALGIYMVAAPHSFFHHIGPFGTYNSHYLRDNATWQLAIGLAALGAALRPRWRGPVLGVATLQIAIHAVNHWADVDKAHSGSSAGWFDAISLTVGAVLLAGVARWALREES